MLFLQQLLFFDNLYTYFTLQIKAKVYVYSETKNIEIKSELAAQVTTALQ
jgi:hypothetical protein